MAQFGSRFHASRNERIASGLANAYIIWKPWSKNACASLFDDEIGRVNVPRPALVELDGLRVALEHRLRRGRLRALLLRIGQTASDRTRRSPS